MPAAPSDPRQLAWRALVESYGELMGRLADELQTELGLPVTWYDVLLHLSDAPGNRRRMTDLARAVVVSKSGLTTIVDRLEDAGLVRREVPPADRRAVDVVMTAAGRRRFETARRFHRQGIDRHFSSQLSRQEGQALFDVLSRFTA